MINARILRSSFEWVAQVTGMNERISSADVLVTATEKISNDSMHDDILYHLSHVAGSQKIPTFVLCNNFIDNFQDYEQLFTGIFSTQMTEYDDEITIFENYESVANQLTRTLLAFK